MKKFLLCFLLLTGCDEESKLKQNKIDQSEKYIKTVFIVKENHKTKFQEDYVWLKPVDSNSMYWIKGERYKSTYNLIFMDHCKNKI
jgi:hypothetical protein